MDLREARFKKRLTQLELYRKTGIFQSVISLWENGYAVPKDSQREAISQALGVEKTDIDWNDKQEVAIN